MSHFLETGRLVLRAFTEADAENLYDLNSDPDVTWYISGGEPTPRDVIESAVIPRFLGVGAAVPPPGWCKSIRLHC